MAKGKALTRLNRAEEGVEFIETSIELNDEDPGYHESLCRWYIKIKSFYSVNTTLFVRQKYLFHQ